MCSLLYSSNDLTNNLGGNYVGQTTISPHTRCVNVRFRKRAFLRISQAKDPVHLIAFFFIADLNMIIH